MLIVIFVTTMHPKSSSLINCVAPPTSQYKRNIQIIFDITLENTKRLWKNPHSEIQIRDVLRKCCVLIQSINFSNLKMSSVFFIDKDLKLYQAVVHELSKHQNRDCCTVNAFDDRSLFDVEIYRLTKLVYMSESVSKQTFERTF